MSKLNNWAMWNEQEGPQDATAVGNPPLDPYGGAIAGNPTGRTDDDPNAAPEQQPPQDVTQDPVAPEMPEEQTEAEDFEIWRREFFELATKADPNEMLDALAQVRNRDLSAPQRKFVEDNVQICLLRQDANIAKASKEIRKLISEEMDMANPGTGVLRHINATLDAYPVLTDIFIKLIGMYGMKSDLYRKFIAGLLGSVQVGGGGDKEDIIYSANEFSINISTRYYTQFGDMTLGGWALEEDDPDRYLSESEVDRLQEGSPEEKRVLRRRVILESIAHRFEDRSFVIHIIDPATGNIFSLAWDISDSLRNGYKEGKFVVRKRTGDDARAMIDDNGAIIPAFDYSVYYLRETGEVNERGKSITTEESFIESRDGILFLVAGQDIIREAGSGMSGMLFEENPYQGNPSDLKSLIRCVPSLIEILMRRC